MTYIPINISLLLGKERVNTHEFYERTVNRPEAFLAFRAAVAKQLGGDVRFHNIDYASALVYRPGDIYTLGEIGYKDLRVKPKPAHQASKPTLFVRARGIHNSTYKSSTFQHRSLAANTLKAALKLVDSWLIHPDAKYTAHMATEAGRKVVSREVSATHEVVRAIWRKLVGDSGYGSSFDGVLWAALRGTELLDQRVNSLLAEFYKAYDVWSDAKAQAGGLFTFVGLRQHDDLLLADVTTATLSMTSSEFGDVKCVRASRLPETTQGRIAVLQMTAPETYVQGVGLRLDDKLFFVVGDEAENGNDW